MDNGLMEIIVKTVDDPKPKQVNFEELHALRHTVESVMFLWTTNSYLIDLKNRLFLINGGRRLEFPRFDDPRLVYRKRTAHTMTVTGGHEASRKVSWILGMQNGEDGEMVIVVISDTGIDWHWANKL